MDGRGKHVPTLKVEKLSTSDRSITSLSAMAYEPRDRLLSFTEVAQLTQLSVSTLRNMLREGDRYCDSTFPKPRRYGRRSVRFLEAEIVAWVNSKPVNTERPFLKKDVNVNQVLDDQQPSSMSHTLRGIDRVHQSRKKKGVNESNGNAVDIASLGATLGAKIDKAADLITSRIVRHVGIQLLGRLSGNQLSTRSRARSIGKGVGHGTAVGRLKRARVRANAARIVTHTQKDRSRPGALAAHLIDDGQ